MKNIFWDKAHLMFSLIVLVIWGFYIFVVSTFSMMGQSEGLGVMNYFIYYMTGLSALRILIIGLIVVYVIITFVLYKKNK